VVSEHGEVRARFVVMACNAYVDGLNRQLDSRIMPVASYVVATEPLGENRARALIRDDDAVSDSNFVVDYFRLTADRRLLFGGRCSYSGIHPKDLAGNMRPRLLRIFPQLADVRAIDYAWGGHIGITYNRLPDVGRIGDNLYYVQGFSGQGVPPCRASSASSWPRPSPARRSASTFSPGSGTCPSPAARSAAPPCRSACCTTVSGTCWHRRMPQRCGSRNLSPHTFPHPGSARTGARGVPQAGAGLPLRR
jgi:hypothetical protein